MEVYITKTNAYANESITVETLEGPSVTKTVNVSDLEEYQKNLVYQFCSENPNATIMIPEAHQLKITVKVVNGTFSEEVKTIENITRPEILQKTGAFVDIVNHVLLQTPEL